MRNVCDKVVRIFGHCTVTNPLPASILLFKNTECIKLMEFHQILGKDVARTSNMYTIVNT